MMRANARPQGMGSSVRVLGTQCFCGDSELAAAAVVDRVVGARGGFVCFCNVHVVVTALHDARLRRSLDSAWRCFADGAPVAWMERRLGHPEAARTPGPDLLLAVLERGEPLGLRHYLLGSTHETVDRLRARLRRRFPQALVVGASSPTIGKDVAPLPDLVEEIRRHTPDIVWCALGAPKQEIWMHLHHEALAPALLVGVGAAFDFTAGTKRRAPAYLQRLGLEWLHRFAAEPRRLGGRYLRTNAEFIFRAGFELLRKTPR